MEAARLENDGVRLGDRLTVSFQRTLRIPDDGRAYPLPPGLGRFPLRRCADFAAVLPRAWSSDFFLPMHRSEALWIAFEGAWWKPNTVQIGIGGINAISGERWEDGLCADPQNYLVVPDQPWLDGVNSGSGRVRQFVAAPLGEGYTVESQLTGKETVGGIQLRSYEPKPGRFPDTPYVRETSEAIFSDTIGIAAGGELVQKIYPDEYGIDAWDRESCTEVIVHLFLAEEFGAITGEPAPATPIDASTYTAAGYPWFALYDDHLGDVAAADVLARLKSMRELDERAPESSVAVHDDQVRKLRPR